VRLLHHVGTSLALSRLRSPILSPSFLLKFESSGEIPPRRRLLGNDATSHKLIR
jgi:hypothetical protein